jgi:hypothetical protein
MKIGTPCIEFQSISLLFSKTAQRFLATAPNFRQETRDQEEQESPQIIQLFPVTPANVWNPTHPGGTDTFFTFENVITILMGFGVELGAYVYTVMNQFSMMLVNLN